jgi:hypothetical protein
MASDVLRQLRGERGALSLPQRRSKRWAGSEWLSQRHLQS